MWRLRHRHRLCSAAQRWRALWFSSQPGEACWEFRSERSAVLSDQQLRVLSAISRGESVFITGAAGTGKTVLLHRALSLLKRLHGEEFVFVTASTGVAAALLGGTTLHRFAGLGNVDAVTKEAVATSVWKSKGCRNNWLKAKALVIGEISMIDKETFEKLEYVGRMVRSAVHDVKIFGGLQLVVAGDFLQLPPVTNMHFAFEADCWDSCFNIQTNLSHIFRQSDVEFVSILNELRVGRCSSKTVQKLRSCEAPLPDDGSGVSPTKLFPRRKGIQLANEEQLRALGQNILTYVASDSPFSACRASLFSSCCTVQNELPLCIGAQVMLIKNIHVESGLVNGARGVVVGFSPSSNVHTKHFEYVLSPNQLWPVVRFACSGLETVIGPEVFSTKVNGHVFQRWQVPLILAWVLTVHKCQGMTLDKVDADLSDAFGYGMSYVALSRVRSLNGLRLIGFDPHKVRANSEVLQYYTRIDELHGNP